jgi:hypothetical protein
MDLNILYRGFSEEDKEAEKILREAGVDFVEIFNDEHNHNPVLCVKESVYSYDGLDEIRGYVDNYQGNHSKK